jgi:hypothetical protein
VVFLVVREFVDEVRPTACPVPLCGANSYEFKVKEAGGTPALAKSNAGLVGGDSDFFQL